MSKLKTNSLEYAFAKKKMEYQMNNPSKAILRKRAKFQSLSPVAQTKFLKDLKLIGKIKRGI